MADTEWREDGSEEVPARRRRLGEWVFAPLTIFGLALLGYGYVRYVSAVDGAARTAALFAGALVVLGGLMLAWGYFRQGDDYLDKLLSGAGQSVLLGAILSFGFAVTGQLTEEERVAREDERARAVAAEDSRRALAFAIRADAGGRTFPEVDVRDQNLVGLDLSGFEFDGADLSGADLSVSDLSGADLTGASLEGADLTEADLTDATLKDADLARSIPFRATLTGAVLTDADLADADLTGADLTGADLTNADLTGADLTGADLTGADLTGADLTGADLTNADLTDARGEEPP